MFKQWSRVMVLMRSSTIVCFIKIASWTTGTPRTFVTNVIDEQGCDDDVTADLLIDNNMDLTGCIDHSKPCRPIRIIDLSCMPPMGTQFYVDIVFK